MALLNNPSLQSLVITFILKILFIEIKQYKLVLLYLLFFFFSEIGSHVAQTDLNPTMWLRMTLNLLFPYLHFSSSGITNLHHHAWFYTTIPGFIQC